MDDFGRVSILKLGNGDVDELHLLPLQHPDLLLQLVQLELVWQLQLHLQNQCSQLNQQENHVLKLRQGGSDVLSYLVRIPDHEVLLVVFHPAEEHLILLQKT